MPVQDDTRIVLAAYGLKEPLDVQSLGSAGGFSGAQFWRVESIGLQFCLRRWPQPHPSRQRLEYIHAVLRHAAACGVREAATPLLTESGESFVQRDGHFWELSPWMTGRPDDATPPKVTRLSAALEALARFHKATATFPGNSPAERPSPGLVERAGQMTQLQQGGLEELRTAISPAIWPEGEAVSRQILEQFQPGANIVQPRLAAALKRSVVLQPCIRDIWRDHVLFEGDRVSGIVDFGAMRDECVAGDVARLVGSYACDDTFVWEAALAAYQNVRPLTLAEFPLVRMFDETSVVLSGIHWIQWIYAEGRQFSQRDKILQRLNVTLHRMRHLI